MAPPCAIRVIALFAVACVRSSPPDASGFGLQELPKDVEISQYVKQNLMEPRHAVAVVHVGKGTKRHLLLDEIASDDTVKHVLTFGVRFARSGSSLLVHRYSYAEETYKGKWTRSAIRAWLLEVGYPSVNRMTSTFAPMKYLTNSAFGTVLIVKPLGQQTDALAKALEPYAVKFQAKLKFTFFTKAAGTQKLCEDYGIWSNDEILLMEDARHTRHDGHTHVPAAPKYRLEEVTPERLESFFNSYAAGTWPRYYKAATPRGAPVVQHGIRELTSWDFVEVVNAPDASVLVEFVSKDCSNCDAFAAAYAEVARKVQHLQGTDKSPLRHVVIARIDQTNNEHSETVRGTPWMKYWPLGRRKKSMDVELRSVDAIVNFLEERAADEIEHAAAEL